MIVTDLDRTLLHNDGSLSPYMKNILSSCYANNILFVFATARPERGTRHLQAGLPVSYVIANNGATIAERGKCIYNNPIDELTRNQMISQFVCESKITNITVEMGDYLFTNDKEYNNWSFYADWNPVLTDFSVPFAGNVPKISVESNYSETVLKIVGNYPEVYVLPNNGENWYQIMHRESSKFNAINYLANLSGISINNVIAFGDDYNDVEMIQKCGTGVAVDNAVA